MIENVYNDKHWFEDYSIALFVLFLSSNMKNVMIKIQMNSLFVVYCVNWLSAFEWSISSVTS